MNFKQSIFISLLVISFVSCDYLLPNQQEEWIAKVGENYLLKADLDNLKAEGKEDSAVIVNSFIDSWIKEQLLLEKARQNLNEKQIDFEKQLENYRNSLIIYEYENQLIKQKLDTLVSAKEIEKYYENNNQNFELRKKVLKARFIKVLNTAPQLDSMKYWFYSKEFNFYGELKEYCTQFSTSCQIDSNAWINNTDLFKILPNVSNEKEIKFDIGDSEFSDSLHTLYLKVEEIKINGELAPLALVKKEIVSIIRNKRKIQLLSKVRKEIFEEATLKRKYEIHN